MNASFVTYICGREVFFLLLPSNYLETNFLSYLELRGNYQLTELTEQRFTARNEEREVCIQAENLTVRKYTTQLIEIKLKGLTQLEIRQTIH